MNSIALTPLLISTTKNPSKTVFELSLGKKFLWFQTESGYLKSDAMIFWIKKILLPYLEFATKNIEDEVSLLILLDNLKEHLTEESTKLYE